jgi:tRNA modification GTPase
VDAGTIAGLEGAMIEETIVAQSSPPGGGGRAVIRLTGPRALEIALSAFSSETAVVRTQKDWVEGEVSVPLFARRAHADEATDTSPSLARRANLPAGLMFWPGPRTYTGQDIVELHTLGSPPLVDLLIAVLLEAGARAAQPGEFTQRAFLAGKMDLTRAEAVLAVIDAGSRSELKRALAQLAGGISNPLVQVRSDLLNLLADVEAALDFAEEDIHFIEDNSLLDRLTRGMAQLTILERQLDRRSLARGHYRAVLAGRPNAGKSSLFNALAGVSAAIVSSTAGTTRDYLSRTLALEDINVELVDTAGWLVEDATITQQAQELGLHQRRQAQLVILCLEAGKPLVDEEKRLMEATDSDVLPVATKCDLHSPRLGELATSARTGLGIGGLRALLAKKAREYAEPALAPSVARCRHHLAAGLAHLRRAHAAVLEQDAPELLALALRETIDEIGAMVGAVYTEDLLDRIFSRFCIGK